MTDIIVLCYHAISPTWEADLSTTPELFESQIAMLSARGYRGATFTEAVSSPAAGPVVAVTFDDAYHSVIELARPILDRFGMPATVFVPTDYIDADGPMCWPGIDRWMGGPHERELTPMSWAELRALAQAGWEIGSHTGSHPHLTSPTTTRSLTSWRARRRRAKPISPDACTSLAYPYGDVDERVVAATAQAGYLCAATLPRRIHSRDALQWPRIGIYRVDDLRFRLKVSPALRCLRRSPAWDWLGALRS